VANDMNQFLITPDILILSFFASVLFAIGVVRYFYAETLHFHVTIYFAIYLITMFSLIQLGTFFEWLPIFLVQMGDLAILQILVLFFSFGLIAAHQLTSVLSEKWMMVMLFLIAGILFPICYLSIQNGGIFHSHLFDQAKYSFLFLATGSLVWFFEVFKNTEESGSNTNSPDMGFVNLLGLPLSLFVSFSNFSSERIFPLLVQYLVAAGFVLVGFVITTGKKTHKRGALFFVLFSTIAWLSATANLSALIQFPLCFVLGLFLPLFQTFLLERGWSEDRSFLLVSFLIVCTASMFAPLIVFPDLELLHPPLVLLGVQSLYLLSVFLISSLVASIVFLFPKR
jgi:hypothetical protein